MATDQPGFGQYVEQVRDTGMTERERAKVLMLLRAPAVMSEQKEDEKGLEF